MVGLISISLISHLHFLQTSTGLLILQVTQK
jgi:hypothetical protein